jgi:ankyrin repeat protein
MDLIDLLLTHGARVDLPPGDYVNCVQIALRHGYPDLAKSFVEKGANGDVADEQKRTPLIEAIILGDEALVRKLLEGGVDIDAQGTIFYPFFCAYDPY